MTANDSVSFKSVSEKFCKEEDVHHIARLLLNAESQAVHQDVIFLFKTVDALLQTVWMHERILYHQVFDYSSNQITFLENHVALAICKLRDHGYLPCFSETPFINKCMALDQLRCFEGKRDKYFRCMHSYDECYTSDFIKVNQQIVGIVAVIHKFWAEEAHDGIGPVPHTLHGSEDFATIVELLSSFAHVFILHSHKSVQNVRASIQNDICIRLFRVLVRMCKIPIQPKIWSEMQENEFLNEKNRILSVLKHRPLQKPMAAFGHLLLLFHHNVLTPRDLTFGKALRLIDVRVQNFAVHARLPEAYLANESSLYWHWVELWRDRVRIFNTFGEVTPKGLMMMMRELLLQQIDQEICGIYRVFRHAWKMPFSYKQQELDSLDEQDVQALEDCLNSLEQLLLYFTPNGNKERQAHLHILRSSLKNLWQNILASLSRRREKSEQKRPFSNTTCLSYSSDTAAEADSCVRWTNESNRMAVAEVSSRTDLQESRLPSPNENLSIYRRRHVPMNIQLNMNRIKC